MADSIKLLALIENNPTDLQKVFEEWNREFFQGALPPLQVRWNSRLSTTAGRFIADRRNPIIEIASYLKDEPRAQHWIRDTMGHELIHYFLWIQRKPYGHTAEFHAWMKKLGVSRYNAVPRHRPFKHCYSCQVCEQKIWVRKRLKGAACAACCNLHAGGKYHPQFKLKLLSAEETRQLEAPGPVVDLDALA